ncbi:MAG TPA: DUF2182 domain-containing protein [Acidimicrobiales bacterium]|nr:DUF2182 domain-containing protein [Acidimicrobiales bacterium]
MTDVALSLPGPGRDTPRAAYRVLERRATLTTVAVLIALAALSWWYTVGQSHDMAAMVQGLAHVGTAMPFDMSVGLFLAMWVAMMVAMMFPTIAPVVLLHRMVFRRGGRGPATTVVFSSGYLLVWAAVGLVPLAVLESFRHLSGGSTWVLRVAGVVLVAAGAYQFTAWKETCLRVCQTPLTFLMTHDFGTGPMGAVRVGVTHGLYCLGCCWALMAVLFVVGLMNLSWMVGIALVFLAEKHWRHGLGLSRVVGTAVIGFGVTVLVHPALLDSIVPLAHAPKMMMG